MNVEVNQQESDEEAAVRGEAAASQHENPTRTSKLPSERVVQLVLGSLLAAALIVIYRLSFVKIQMNQTLQTLKEENEALKENFSDEIFLKCEEGCEKLGEHLYYFSKKKSSWTEGRRFCKDLGGDLVKIDSREEQKFLEGKLKDLMENDKDKFWIGLTDSEEEGRWLWVDGSPLDESLKFWMPWEPDDWKKEYPSGEDCGGMGTTGRSLNSNCWFDLFCDLPQRSICEKPADFPKPETP